MFDSVFGSLYQARLRQLEQETKHTALRNGILQADYLARAELEFYFEEIARSIVLIIETSRLSREEKADIRRQLAAIPVAIESVARNSSNGSGAEPRSRPAKPRQKKRKAEAKEASGAANI